MIDSNVRRLATLEQVTKVMLCVEHGAKTKGFAKAVRRFVAEKACPEDAEDLRLKFVPDAWRIDNEGIKIWEIEDTNKLSINKLRKIADFWVFCDDNWL